MERGDGLRTRSFRNEDYTNRRVFLTSYPLHFDHEEDHQETHETPHATTRSSHKVHNRPDTYESPHGYGYKKKKDEKKMKIKIKKKKEAIKTIMVRIVKWGDERVVIMKRFKDKVSFYVVACFPIVFKPPKALISTR